MFPCCPSCKNAISIAWNILDIDWWDLEQRMFEGPGCVASDKSSSLLLNTLTQTLKDLTYYYLTVFCLPITTTSPGARRLLGVVVTVSKDKTVDEPSHDLAMILNHDIGAVDMSTSDLTNARWDTGRHTIWIKPAQEMPFFPSHRAFYFAGTSEVYLYLAPTITVHMVIMAPTEIPSLNRSLCELGHH